MRSIGIVLTAVAMLLGPVPAQAQSVSEMAGQMLMLGFNGQSVDASGVVAVREQIASGKIGGVMYLRTNVADLPSVRAMNRSFAVARPWLPPFIALDQEGGQIERLTGAVGFPEIASAEAIAAKGLDTARTTYAGLAQQLGQEGFNVNFGPVVDLDLNPANPIIGRYQRAYGVDPETVTAFAQTFIEGHRQSGLATSLKHFPGHGSSRTDTHDGFVDVTDLWQPLELEPYRALIAQDLADMVMVAHLYNGDVQANGQQLPASLSPRWIDEILRGELGYNGVVITDDLEMGAIRSRFELEEVVQRAVMAGVDILLFSNTAQYDAALGVRLHDMLVAMADDDPAFEARVRESYRRIVNLKRSLGIVP